MRNGFNKFLLDTTRAETTLSQYNQAYKVLTQVVEPDMPCTSLSPAIIKNIINYLKKRNNNVRNTTINTTLRPIKAFIYFLANEGYIDGFKIKLLAETRIPKIIYTQDELSTLIKKPDLKKCRFSQYRNWVLINYFLATGNRLRTVTNLKCEDLDFKNQLIHLKTLKCNNPYIIPMSDHLKIILLEYMKYRKGSDNDYLFPTQYGKKMSVNGLHSVLATYNRSKNIAKTSTQLFRPTFAKMYKNNGGELQNLQLLLGHEKLETTRIYLSPTVDDIAVNMNSINPLDKLKNQLDKTVLKMNQKNSDI